MRDQHPPNFQTLWGEGRGGWSIVATSTESDHFPVFVGHLACLHHVSKFNLCVLWSMGLRHLKGRVEELLWNCTLLRELNPSRNKTEIDAEEPLTAIELQRRLLPNTYWYPRVFFPLELEVRAWLLVTDRVFISMTKQPGHKPTGKESDDHNLKKWVRSLFPGGGGDSHINATGILVGKSVIYTAKRDDEHPHHFYMAAPHPPRDFIICIYNGLYKTANKTLSCLLVL